MDDISMEPLNNSAIGNIFIYILCFSDESLGSVYWTDQKVKTSNGSFLMNLYCISFMRLA